MALNKFTRAFLALLALSAPLTAGERSNWSIYGNAHFNHNMHRTNGFVIEPICPACVNIKDGNTPGFGLSLGLINHPDTRFLGMEYMPGLALNFDLVGGKIENENFLGNIIEGNTLKQGLVRYTLDNNVSFLSLEPFVYFYPFQTIRTALKIGANFAFPMNKSYTFSETVLTDGATLPDGTRSKTYPQTELNNTSLMISIPIGLKYDAFKTDKFIVSPEVSYSFALTDFQSDSKWKVNRFAAGLSLVYRLDKPEPPKVDPPRTAPLPELPIPNKERNEIECIARWEVGGTPAENNATIAYSSTSYNYRVPVLPYIFFDENSAEFAQTPTKKKTTTNAKSGDIAESCETQQATFIDRLPEILRDQNSVSLKVTFLDNEKANIGTERLANTLNYLVSNGINTSDIKTSIQKIPSKKIKYTQLAEEYRSASFDYPDLNNKTDEIPISTSTSYPNVDVRYILAPKSDEPIKTIEGTLRLESGKTIPFNSSTVAFTVDSADLASYGEDFEIVSTYTITDIAGTTREFSDDLTISLKEKQTEKVYNFAGKYREFVVAINSFDKQQPFIICTGAVNEIKSAIKDGKRVDLMGLTDNLGSRKYNMALSKRRVNAIIKQLDIDPKKIRIATPEDYIFDNNTTYGRMLNRSVIVRIYDK